jgi:predicted DNA repair protein MutK
MPSSAFFAVLRDTAKLAASAADDLAAQSAKLSMAADDIASLTGKAAVKTAGVAGDDLAVGAGQVGEGLSPNRELPALWAITKGSAFNKAWLSAVLLVVSAVLPVAITVALCIGALYLAYEGAEALLERFHPHSMDGEFEILSESQKVKGAIRTDLVLSLEILVIALASTGEAPLAYKAAVLFLVSVVMTVGVYGLIGLIIRLDDMGLALAKSGSAWRRALGRKLVSAAPAILKFLDPVGMVAMFAVAGGIFTHLAHVAYPHWALGFAGDILAGVVIGLALAAAGHLVHRLRGTGAASLEG